MGKSEEPVLFGDYLNTEIVKRKLVKIKDLEELGSKEGVLKVLNVGSYDILTPGHKNTIYFSKNIIELYKFPNYPKLPIYRDMNPEDILLLVAMNSDKSFEKWDNKYKKIGKRKIATHNEQERIWQLANEECVDHIVLFNGFNAKSIIKRFKPDIYTKGGDYVIDPKYATKERPPIDQEERKLVEKQGGSILLMPAAYGKKGKLCHSYNLVQRIKDNHK